MELRDHCKSIFYWLFIASMVLNFAQWYFGDYNPQGSRMEIDVQNLVENTSEFYIYRVNPDNNTLTDQEIIAQGGDCKDWAEYYNRTLSRSYQTEYIRYSINETHAHAFLLVHNEEGYCIVDQTKFSCFERAK